MTRALIILAFLITVVALVIEFYVGTVLLFHVWAGSFAPTPEATSHHRSMIGLMSAIGLLTAFAVAWIWIATRLLFTRGRWNTEAPDRD